MSVDPVPDERGSKLEGTFWALIIAVGLGAFLYDFLMVLLGEAAPGQPIGIIHDFQQTLFLIAILGGGATVALVAYGVYAHSAGRRPAPDLPDVGQGRFTLSVFVIGLAFLMTTTMFVGASTLAQTDEAGAAEAAGNLDVSRQLDVDISAAQWSWRADVDGVPFTQQERIVVPAGTVINLDITSADVIHSFAIQELGVKKDAVPGQVNSAWLLVEHVEGETTVEAAGEALPADSYTLTCAELCGKGHSQMVGSVLVLEPEDYETWVAANGGSVPDSFHADDGGGHDEGGDGGDDHDESGETGGGDDHSIQFGGQSND